MVGLHILQHLLYKPFSFLLYMLRAFRCVNTSQCVPGAGADAGGAVRAGQRGGVPHGLEPPHLCLRGVLRAHEEGGLPLPPPRPVHLLVLHARERSGRPLPAELGHPVTSFCIFALLITCSLTVLVITKMTIEKNSMVQWLTRLTIIKVIANI